MVEGSNPSMYLDIVFGVWPVLAVCLHKETKFPSLICQPSKSIFFHYKCIDIKRFDLFDLINLTQIFLVTTLANRSIFMSFVKSDISRESIGKYVIQLHHEIFANFLT